jgi:putative sigma-54 modulation protein
LGGYFRSKLFRLRRLFDQLFDITVLLTVQKQKETEKRQRAECSVRVKGSDLFAEASHFDLYAAIDALVDKLDRQVVRHKTRVQDHQAEVHRSLMQAAGATA